MKSAIVIIMAAFLLIAGCVETAAPASPIVPTSAPEIRVTATPQAAIGTATTAPADAATPTKTRAATTEEGGLPTNTESIPAPIAQAAAKESTHTESYDAYCTDNFGGFVCEGFCFSAPNAACIDGQFVEPDYINPAITPCTNDAQCIPFETGGNKVATRCDPLKHLCSATTADSQLRRQIRYDAVKPESVASGTDFKIMVNVRNTKDFPASFQAGGVDFYNFAGPDGKPAAGYNYSAILDSANREAYIAGYGEKTLEYALKAGAPAMTATVLLKSPFQRSAKIIVYDQSKPTAKCGGKTFNKQDGVCENSVLYPVQKGGACKAGAACPSGGKCVDGLCLNTPGLNASGTYNVAITTAMFSGEDREFKALKLEAESKLTRLAGDANAWWQAERKRHPSASVDLKFSYVPCVGDTSGPSQLSDLQQTRTLADYLELEARRCNIDGTQYPIRVFVAEGSIITSLDIQNEFAKRNWPFKEGINAGRGLAILPSTGHFDQKLSSLARETLRTFGLPGISAAKGQYAADFQMRGCFLARGFPEAFDAIQQLCPFEAKAVGLEAS